VAPPADAGVAGPGITPVTTFARARRAGQSRRALRLVFGRAGMLVAHVANRNPKLWNWQIQGPALAAASCRLDLTCLPNWRTIHVVADNARNEENDMQSPLEITFHGVERSEAVEARVREKFQRIESHFDRITHARVVIEAPQRRTPLPKFFHVRIELSIPGQAPIVVKHEPDAEHAQTDIMLALRDAFATAQRQVDELASRREKQARHERVRRKPTAGERGEA
jgi:ribosome-associated translation inhibitor RaiA